MTATVLKRHDHGRWPLVAAAILTAWILALPAFAGEDPKDVKVAPSDAGKRRSMEIVEYDIEGNTVLDREDVEKAVYPFLGPDKTLEDVKQMRDALESLYRDKGFQAVQVVVPPQSGADGIVHLKVIEGKVGRLRVVGAENYLPSEIKAEVPSLKEGTVLDFNKVQDDLAAVNQWPGRRVTPSLKAGTVPGTVDVDLSVEDKDPLTASLEVNNRQSLDTTDLRTIATVGYGNLWQLGHSFMVSWEAAPRNLNDDSVWSISYLAPIPDSRFSVLLSGFRSNSNVASLGSSNQLGKGTSVGVRGFVRLPNEEGYYHNAFVGVDWKKFHEDTIESGIETKAPIRYYPFTIGYNGTLVEDFALTQGEISAVFASPNWGSDSAGFELKRAGSRGQQSYLKGSLSRTDQLPSDFESYFKIEGQLTDQMLISNEQFSVGGYDSVRGYYESEITGDYGLRGSVELRGPSMADWLETDGTLNQFRLLAFADAAHLWVMNPFPSEQRSYALHSVGFGLRAKAFDCLNGAFDFAIPLTTTDNTRRLTGRFLFRTWTEY